MPISTLVRAYGPLLIRLTMAAALLITSIRPTIAAPRTQSGTPSIAATQAATLIGDADGDGKADPGDGLRYTVTVSNTGTSAAQGVTLAETLDANTILSGTVRAAPLANGDTYTATNDTPLVVTAGNGLLNNDFGLPAPSVVAQIASPTAQGGTVTMSAAGAFTYTAPVAFVGADSFTYSIGNSSGADAGSVTLNVFAAPQANGDSYTAVLNTPLTVAAGSGVLANDAVAGGSLIAFDATSTQGGAVNVNADGSFVYTPTLGFFSPPTDTFSYTIANAVRASTGVVSITVDLPGPPVAVNDSITTTANTPLTLPAPGVLSNDTVNGATLSSYAATSSQGGAVTLNANGGFTYTPPANFISPPADTFTYTLSNALGNSTATVSLAVQPAGPPVAVMDAYTATANLTLTVSASGVLANDTLNFATLIGYAATTAQTGTVSLNADGSFTYTPPLNFVGGDTFTYTLSNTLGDSTTTVGLVVNPPPTDAVDDGYTAVADTPLTVTVASGVLNNDTLNWATLTDYAATTTRGGSVTLNTDGSFSYTPPAGVISPPTDTFTYTLTNAISTDTATVTLTINPPGTPVAVNDTYTTTANLTLTVSAAGVFANDTRNFAALSSYAATSARGGSVTLNGDGSFVYAPPTDTVSPPTDTFTYTLSNALGDSTGIVSITLYPSGPPITVNDAFTATANAPLTLPAPGVLANDTVNFATLSDYAATTTRGGSVTLNANGSFVYTPPADTISPPSDTFTYTLSNLLGNSTATVSITLYPPGPPVAANDSYTATRNLPRSFTAPGVLGNDTVNFAVISSYAATTEQSGAVSLNADGSFLYTPPLNFVGGDTFTYTLSNALGNSTATVAFTVVPPPPDAVNDVYAVTGNVQLVVPSGTGLLANDSLNLATLTLSPTTSAQGGNVAVNADGSFSYNPPAGFTGTDTFTYTLTNVTASDIATATLTVSDRVWFVNNTATPGGDGRRTAPFNTLAAAEAASAAGDILYVYFGDGTNANQNAGITLRANQQLIGQHVALVVGGNTLEAAVPGNRPAIGNPAGNGVSITTTVGIEVRGFNLSGSTNAVDVATSGSANAGLVLRDNVIASAGAEGVDVTHNSTGALTLDVRDNVFNAGVPGLDVIRSAGTLTITNFANNTFAGALTGTAVNINGATFDAAPGGAFDQVTGNVLSIGSLGNGVGGAGLVLTNVAGDVAFTDLDVFADGGAGISLTGTGVFATNSGFRLTLAPGVGVVAAIGGPAVNASAATLDLPLLSLSSSGSPTTGVALNAVAGTFSAGAGSSISNATGTDFSVDGGSGTVTYNGVINNTSGRSVSVTNRTGGTITFGGAISDTGSGILLNANSGSTVTFSGGLTVSTGANPAFTATGGGMVNVTGANNTLQTTTSTALSVSNTTIGASGLTFRSINANGAPNGVVLLNTGNNAGLIVTGTGAAGSGGLIQNSTSTGVSLTNARDISLSYMTIQGSGDDGVYGANVTNFTLASSTVTNNGNSGADEGLEFDNLWGTASLTNVTVSGSAHNNVWIENTSGTLTSLTVANSQIQNTAAPFGASGFLFVAGGTASVAAASITGTTFANHAATGLMVQAQNTAAIGDFAIQTSTFTNQDNALNFTQSHSASLNFRVLNNATIQGSAGHALNVFSSATTTGGSLNGRITDNAIGNAGSADSGSTFGNGIRVFVQAQTDSDLLIDNNVIRQTPLGRGIEVTGGSDSLDVTITNNNVNPQDTSGFPLAAILVLADNTTGTVNGTMRADVRNNIVPAASNTFDYPGFDGAGPYLWLEEVTGTTLELVDTAPLSADATAQLTNTNTGSAGASAGVALIAGPIGLPPQLAAEGEGPGAVAITVEQLEAARAAAAGRWVASGLSADATARLASVTVQVTDLPAGQLAEADERAGVIYLDADGAGWGWFVDGTPTSDDDLAAGRIDALTVLMHEMGHLIGLPHSAEGLMTETLSVGVRHTPGIATEAPSAVGAAALNINIGTLPAGRAVTLVFEVTIASPLPSGITQVSNQGTVSGDNFAATLTDDPATPALNDATVTLLDGLKFVYLPLVMKDYAVRADLSVSVSLTPNKTSFGAGEPVLITVVVSNNGNAPASDFWVDAYLNPSSPPTAANQVWSDRCGMTPCYGLAWHVTQPLNPGQSVTLTSTAGSYVGDNTLWPGAFAAGTTELYVYADSYSDDGGSNGQVLEQNETNNRAELHGLSVTGLNAANDLTATSLVWPRR